MIWNGEKCDQRWFSVIQNGRRQRTKNPKMATGVFCETNSKKIKLCIDLKWREMRSKVIFGHSKWPPGVILPSKYQKYKSCLFNRNSEKCDQRWFSVIQNGCRQPFCENMSKQIKIAYWSEMTSVWHHNGQPVNHSGIYPVFALWQIHQF